MEKRVKGKRGESDNKQKKRKKNETEEIAQREEDQYGLTFFTIHGTV